jgi:hypothetical protein
MKVGQRVRIPADSKHHPETGHHGKCVWKSKDGETVAIECERGHSGKKNTVFLLKLNSK